MKKYLSLAFAFIVSFQIYSSENIWELISGGSYDVATEISLSRNKSENIYNLYLSTLYNILGDLDKAAIYNFEYFKNPANTVQKAIQNAEEITNRHSHGNVLAFFGVQLWELGQKDIALEYLEMALQKKP